MLERLFGGFGQLIELLVCSAVVLTRTNLQCLELALERLLEVVVDVLDGAERLSVNIFEEVDKILRLILILGLFIFCLLCDLLQI